MISISTCLDWGAGTRNGSRCRKCGRGHASKLTDADPPGMLMTVLEGLEAAFTEQNFRAHRLAGSDETLGPLDLKFPERPG